MSPSRDGPTAPRRASVRGALISTPTGSLVYVSLFAIKQDNAKTVRPICTSFGGRVEEEAVRLWSGCRSDDGSEKLFWLCSSLAQRVTYSGGV